MTSYKAWIAAILGAVFLVGCGKSPESTVESFYKAVAKGEITEAQGYVSAQLVGMMGQGKISAALSQQTESIRKCGGIKSVDVKLQGEGDVRSGSATVNYANCKANTEKVELIKEDGKWKITASK
jgi:PBP1b-binding outer membrane lipoprotein LpoB